MRVNYYKIIPGSILTIGAQTSGPILGHLGILNSSNWVGFALSALIINLIGMRLAFHFLWEPTQ